MAYKSNIHNSRKWLVQYRAISEYKVV